MKSVSKLIISIVGCELVGIIGSLFTVAAIPNWYATLNKPFFAPPNWLFGPVWTLLYFLMGVSFYIVSTQGWKKAQVKTAIYFFLAQLGINFLWTPVFFGLKSPSGGLILIILMLFSIVLTMRKFYVISKWAAYLLIPYLLWVTFATLLNSAIVILN